MYRSHTHTHPDTHKHKQLPLSPCKAEVKDAREAVMDGCPASHLCVLVVRWQGCPMSLWPRGRLGLKYSSAVSAVGLVMEQDIWVTSVCCGDSTNTSHKSTHQYFKWTPANESGGDGGRLGYLFVPSSLNRISIDSGENER